MKINYLDLFSGIGGFTNGLLQAGFEFDWHGYSEIDQYALQIYQKHFPKAEELGNVIEINTGKLPKIDLITFGFPCQNLSIAGKREGLQASRSGLFFEATRIIEATRPDYFIFENVKGLFSSNNGADFILVLQEIANIGYDGQWQLLNTRWFLPQNRERLYFVGYPRGKPRPEIFPIGENAQTYDQGARERAHIIQKPHGFNKGGYKKYPNLRAEGDSNHNEFVAVPNEKYVSSTIDSNYWKGPSKGYGGLNRQLIQIGNVDKKGHNSIWGRVYDPNGISATINAEGGGLGAKTGLYAVALTETRTEEAKKIRRETKDRDFSPRRGKEVVERKDEMSNTITATHGVEQTIKVTEDEGMQVRRLTPIECERLQGFDDGWTEEGTEGPISDTQRYKCLGNAVSVPLVFEIAKRLKGIEAKAIKEVTDDNNTT